MYLGAPLKGNFLELQDVLAQNLGVDPAPSGGTKKGLIWFNTATSLLKVWDGTTVNTVTNILEGVTGVGAITAGAVTGKSQAISIAAASGGAPGTMSAADFTKLAAATALSTGSTIVLRDGSGNFAAGTITANLTGTASNATNLNSQAASYYLARGNHSGTQVAATISDFDTAVRTSRLDQMTAPTASVSMGNQRLTSLAEPSAASDAATKNYVDSVASGLDVKGSVRAASLAANIAVTYTATGGASGRGQITLAPNTLDGVSLAAGNRVLLKAQTTGPQNGIWVVTTLGTGANGIWDRATDFDTDAEVSDGAFTFVEEGTQASSGWVLTNNDPVIIGGASGTALVFQQFSGSGSYLAGNGLNLAGQTFSVVAATLKKKVSGAGVDIAATYVGQTSLTTLGTVTAGTWNAAAVAILYGGTGGTSVATAKTNLGFMTRFSQDIGNGALTTFAITHSLGTLDVQVAVYEKATGREFLVDVTRTSTSVVTIDMGFAPATNAYRVVVIG